MKHYCYAVLRSLRRRIYPREEGKDEGLKGAALGDAGGQELRGLLLEGDVVADAGGEVYHELWKEISGEG
jgi:hypothetical protein